MCMCGQTQEEWQGGGLGTLLCLLSLQYTLHELDCRFVVSYAMHPAIRKCLSNLGFSDAAPAPAPGLRAATPGRTGESKLDVSALFGRGGAGCGASSTTAAAGGTVSRGDRNMLHRLQPVWKSVADLRFAAINRVLDCNADDPYPPAAIIQYASAALL